MRRRAGWLFVAPSLLHLAVFALLPIGYALYISLFKWQLFRNDPKFVGLGNYAYTMSDSPFWNAMWNSFRYTAVSVPAGMILSLAVAILVNQRLRGTTIFRTIFYIPSISSGVAISMLWIWIFLPETGLLNSALGAFGIAGVDFLNRTEYAMWALAFMSMWTGLGPRMILFIAGLVGISESLYEAASLDGATGMRAFRSITLPMLAPTTFFVFVTSSIAAMQVFTPVYMMTKGGPAETTDVVGYHIYSEAWLNFNTGLAAAQSFVLLAVIVAISAIQFRAMNRQLQGYAAA